MFAVTVDVLVIVGGGDGGGDGNVYGGGSDDFVNDGGMITHRI